MIGVTLTSRHTFICMYVCMYFNSPLVIQITSTHICTHTCKASISSREAIMRCSAYIHTSISTTKCHPRHDKNFSFICGFLFSPLSLSFSVRVCVYIYIYIHAYTYIYIHAYIHAHCQRPACGEVNQLIKMMLFL
jgi:hypothetical protein